MTTFRRVAAGTDGAASIEGTLAGVLASVALAVAAWMLGLVSSGPAVIAVAAAFLGSTLESYVGAATEGRRPIDNEALNLLNTVVGGVAALVLYAYAGQWR